MFNNKLLFLIILIILLIFLLKSKKESFTNNNRFKLVVTTFNPGKYLEKCLESIERQKYKNYDVCVIDDASTKDINYIREIIFDYCNRNNWKYSFQKKNVGPLKSRINAINKLKCKDDDILIFIDGDDMLSSSNVLTILNKYYQEDIYVTFGSFLIKTKNNIKKEKYIYCDENIIRKIKNKKVRNINDTWYFSHLKTKVPCQFSFILICEISTF